MRRRRLLAVAACLATGPAMAQGRVDIDTLAEVQVLLSQAEALLAGPDARRQAGAAAVKLEQAETRLLTRSTVAGTEGRPVGQGPVAELAAARQALGRGDVAAARQAIARVMAAGGGRTRSLGPPR